MILAVALFPTAIFPITILNGAPITWSMDVYKVINYL